MIPKVSIGYFIESEDDFEFVERVTFGGLVYCHVSFYERASMEKYYEQCLPFVDSINSIHLCKDLHLDDFKKGGLVNEVHEVTQAKFYNLHPWADGLDDIVQEVIENADYTLCLENFGLKHGRYKGNPIFLLTKYGRYMLESEKIRLTIDLSHLENDVANYTFVKSLLPMSKLMHVSCRVGKAQHQHIFTGNSDVNARNIVGQTLSLPECFIDEFILEYMKGLQQRAQLLKHAEWLKDVIQAKRRKFKDG